MKEIEISEKIEQLLIYAQQNLNLIDEDVIWSRNYLMDLLKVKEPFEGKTKLVPLQEILDALCDYAVEQKLCEDFEKLLFETKIMGYVIPMPSKVIELFDDIASQKGIKCATDWFYNFCVKSNYIRKKDIDKNLKWEFNGRCGKIKITINLSKPEKDPEEVKRAATAKMGYPKCMLCSSNVGFAGNAAHPARQTLRTIPIELNNENWFMQFSPYVYFENHLIAICEEHRPMNITKASFERMADFINLFPHYFIGSNASLPIVGGSILAHDHYQGGNKVLPILEAKNKNYYKLEQYPDVNIIIPDWYNSVVKIESKNRKQAIEAANHIFETWVNYTDEEVNITAWTTEDGKKVQHNIVTPTLQFNKDGEYSYAFILRNNCTSKERPYGIFHPSEDLHNIKKEAIGIIEAMGLFILPGRLASEAAQIKDILTGKTKLDFKSLADEKNPLNKHLGMIAQLTNDLGTNLGEKEAEEAVTNAINSACEKILETTAVFKNDEKGVAAFAKFMQACGCIGK